MEEIWLTQDAFDRLTEELAFRSGEHREEIKNRIAAAREEGDLKENGGYHAAREEQGKNEARVKQLTHMLEHAQIGVPPAAEGKVSHGMLVTVYFPAFDDRETFILGSREEAAHAQVDVYSPTSPLGSAVLGQEIGASVTYQTPNGKELIVEIVSAEIYLG